MATSKCVNQAKVSGLEEVLNEVSVTARHFGRGLIGFSTGCLYQSNLDLADKLKMFLRAGSTVLELSFARPQDLLDFELTEPVASKLRKFSKITVHAPWKNIKYFDGSSLAKQIIVKIIRLNELFFISGVVFHPDVVMNFPALDMAPLPVVIENMDSHKKYGISVDDMAILKASYDFGFVLDVQHAYEHDHSLVLARELIAVMGDRLRHLHVSGQTLSSRHAPVHVADNKMAICRLLRVLPRVPVVLEGVILDNISATTKVEMAYVSEQGDPLLPP